VLKTQVHRDQDLISEDFNRLGCPFAQAGWQRILTTASTVRVL
jgi:hypothetical protein